MSPSVAIIGSGLSGLSLALALHQQGISCTIYESRVAPLNIGGAVMLSPNALRVLDALGAYENAKKVGYSFDTLHFRDLPGNLLEVYEFGNEEKYGYRGLRIFRYQLIDTLLALVKAAGIPVVFGAKFVRVEETDRGVTFSFADGSTQTVPILVGADGIHSTLKLPEGYHVPVTISHPVHGAFVIAPQHPDGSQVLIGRQCRMKDRDRASWDEVFADKAASVAFLQADSESFPDIMRNGVSSIDPSTINVWPFYIVPKLDRWASAKLRVPIIGDAAHALPPSAGQGINQAFEDAYMLALIVARAGEVDIESALAFWQKYRQERVDKILHLNQQIDIRRMPADDKVTSAMDKEPFDLEWLYSPNVKKDVNDWVAAHKAGAA